MVRSSSASNRVVRMASPTNSVQASAASPSSFTSVQTRIASRRFCRAASTSPRIARPLPMVSRAAHSGSRSWLARALVATSVAARIASSGLPSDRSSQAWTRLFIAGFQRSFCSSLALPTTS